MKCRACGLKMKVIGTVNREDVIWRYRKCQKCGRRYKSIERITKAG